MSVSHPQVQVLTFYDNWSWISPVIEIHQATLVKTVSFCEMLRLKIDFGKSWAWGTTKELRRLGDHSSEQPCRR